MKYLLLNIIQFYWILIPKSSRRKCIFEKSCSHYVFEQTKANGLKVGLKELKFRFKNCQPQYDIFTDFKTGKKKMILKTGIIIDEQQIAERLR